MRVFRAGIPNPKSVYANAGLGDIKKIGIHLRESGIGDDLHAMPAVSWLCDNGYDVTVIGTPFTRECWESCGAKFLNVFDVGMSKMMEFGRYYILNQWSVWEEMRLGYSPMPRFNQFAELVHAELPEKFSWLERLEPWNSKHEMTWELDYKDVRKMKPYIVFSPAATSRWRMFPKWKSLWLFLCLRHKYHKVLWVESKTKARGGWNKIKSIPFELAMKLCFAKRYKCFSFREMMYLVYHSDRVVGVDSGITNLAAAFGKPVIGIFGITDGEVIMSQFKRYVAGEMNVIQGKGIEDRCKSPCWEFPENGFTDELCCGQYKEAACLKGIKIENILSIALN